MNYATHSVFLRHFIRCFCGISFGVYVASVSMVVLLPLRGDRVIGFVNPGCRYALPRAMSRLPLRGVDIVRGINRVICDLGKGLLEGVVAGVLFGPFHGGEGLGYLLADLFLAVDALRQHLLH